MIFCWTGLNLINLVNSYLNLCWCIWPYLPHTSFCITTSNSILISVCAENYVGVDARISFLIFKTSCKIEHTAAINLERMTPLGLKCNKTQLYRIRSNSCSHSVHILLPACTLLCNFPNSALHFVFTVWILTLRSLKKQVRVLKYFMQERLFFHLFLCTFICTSSCLLL